MCSTLGAAVMCDSIFLKKQVSITVLLESGGKGSGFNGKAFFSFL